jgi:cytoskeletal protein CcmA (bactofilin family)
MADDSKIDSVVGKGTVIDGNLRVNGSTKIDGTVKGSVNAKQTLIVGKDSLIKGDVVCRSAIIGGTVEGNLNVQEIVEFQSGARMLGDIMCKGLIVQEGVFFEGNCRMSQKPKEKE